MLIIRMILRITGLTQENLANLLGVSRASVNCWINDGEIGLNSKKIICNYFNFPIEFFDVNLDENIELYRLIYTTIKTSWDKLSDLSSENEIDKINRILNEIEIEKKTINKRVITEKDIMDGLYRGYDCFTGEVFDEEHILANQEVKKLMNKLYKLYQNKTVEYSDLNDKQQVLYEKLRSWRLAKARELAVSPFIIFTNRELLNIVCAQIRQKEDLLNVSGIGETKYSRYGDELLYIIENGVY